MVYVIYHTESTRLLFDRKRYNCERSAKGALTKAANKGRLLKGTSKEDYSIAEAGEFYDNIEKQVERINLMSGKPYMESVNTPSYCSPSSEAYWSM